MDSLIQIYNNLRVRKRYLLNIIGNTDMSKYTIKTMLPNQFVHIFKVLNDPELTDEGLYWANYQLKLWDKYKANLELSFLNAQIDYIHKLIEY
jgi:hypothetical protein